MPKLSAADIRTKIELLQRDIDDAKRPSVVRRYPALIRPELVVQRATEMAELKKLLREAESGGGRPIGEAYEFQVGTTMTCTEDELIYVFLGWSATGPARLPIFGALVPHTLDMRRRSPSRIATLLKLFPTAHYYERLAAKAIPKPRRPARAVSQPTKNTPVRSLAEATAGQNPRVSDVYDFPLGTKIPNKRGRTYEFVGWVENSSGRMPHFVHKNEESGKDWNLRPVYENTLLRQFPEAARFRRSASQLVA